MVVLAIIFSMTTSSAGIQASQPAPSIEWKDMNWKQKIWKVVKVAAVILAALAAFLYNPIAFTLAMLIGFVCHIQVSETMTKVKTLADNHPFLFYPMSALILFFSIPASPLIAVCTMGTYIGAEVGDYTSKKQNIPAPTAVDGSGQTTPAV